MVTVFCDFGVNFLNFRKIVLTLCGRKLATEWFFEMFWLNDQKATVNPDISTNSTAHTKGEVLYKRVIQPRLIKIDP